MKLYLHLCIAILLTVTLNACEAQPQRELYNVLLGQDQQSPLLLASKSTTSHQATCYFNETVFCVPQDFSCPTDSVKIISVVPFEETIIITFAEALSAGQRVEIEGRVRDVVGNTLTFKVGVWGFNDRIPTLLINEFTTKGSGKNPDRIELWAKTEGNLAGVTIYDGVASTYDSQCILPSFEVSAGDYIVIQYGKDFSQEHSIEFDGGSVGLGANNGAISLYDAPNGSIIDAVVYSNRTSDSDTNYGGFGTNKVCQRVRTLESTGNWEPLPIIPETAVDSTYSTATRSFCREKGVDTNTKNDWYIVPTSKASFGKVNTSERYAP